MAIVFFWETSLGRGNRTSGSSAMLPRASAASWRTISCKDVLSTTFWRALTEAKVREGQGIKYHLYVESDREHMQFHAERLLHFQNRRGQRKWPDFSIKNVKRRWDLDSFSAGNISQSEQCAISFKNRKRVVEQNSLQFGDWSRKIRIREGLQQLPFFLRWGSWIDWLKDWMRSI